MLIVSGSVRFYKQLETMLIRLINKNRKLYQVFMGFIHGLTNMGGGLLILLSSSTQSNKLDVRSSVAYGYFFMGALQYLTLMVYDASLLKIDILYYVIIATLAYYLLGKQLFFITHEGAFRKIITAIIFLYGVILIVK